MVADQEARAPLAFMPIRGSVNDASTLVDTVNEFMACDAKPEGFVMGKGLWTESNMVCMAVKGVKRMLPVPARLSWGRKLIKETRSHAFDNAPYVDKDNDATYWRAAYDPRNEGRRAWAHVFCSPKLEGDRKDAFMRKCHECKKGLMDDAPVESHQPFYDSYFEVSRKGRGGKPHVIEKRHMGEMLEDGNFGCWILYTDFGKDAAKALATYRDRNFIEAGFDDIKGSTDGRRLRIHDAEAIYGRLFIQFCAQMLRTGLRSMADGFRKETRKRAATPDKTLSRLGSLARIKYAGRLKDQYVALSEGQRLILEDIGIKLDFAADVDSADMEAPMDSGQD